MFIRVLEYFERVLFLEIGGQRSESPAGELCHEMRVRTASYLLLSLLLLLLLLFCFCWFQSGFNRSTSQGYEYLLITKQGDLVVAIIGAAQSIFESRWNWLSESGHLDSPRNEKKMNK